MGRKEIGFCTAVCFLGAWLAVMMWGWLGIRKCLEERSMLAALELRMVSMELETQEKQLKIAKWYNWSLEQGHYVPEWDYQNILDLGEGRMGLLRIPELKLRLPITHGIGRMVGHDPATALPTGGREEQTVLYIEKPLPWRAGMAIKTDLPGAELEWQVDSIQVMPSGWPTDQPEGDALLTLVYDKGNTRTLVRCRPGLGDQREAELGKPLKSDAFFWGMLPFFVVPLCCGLGKILFFIHPRKRKRENVSDNCGNYPKNHENGPVERFCGCKLPASGV